MKTEIHIIKIIADIHADKGGRDVAEPSDKLHTLFSDQVFLNSDLSLILLDQEANIVKLTPTAATILGGKDPEAFLQQKIFKIFEYMNPNRPFLTKNILSVKQIRNKAMTWYNGEQKFELLIDTYPIVDGDHLLGKSVFMKDVTNVRLLENQIQHNERLVMIGQMAAGTAHEIRNPLTSIKGFLQIIKQTCQNYDLSKEVNYTHIMLEEIERINHLVGEFLLLSRSKDSKFEKINLQILLEQSLPMIQNEALLQGVEVKAYDFHSLPLVTGNRDLLKQVFLNLCKNAIEAMKEGGTLTITNDVLREERQIKIDFHDTGPGISAYERDKIFEPFFTTKEEGTGLGLSVCQKIIHDMGGKVRVYSGKQGCTFQIYIPYMVEEL